MPDIEDTLRQVDDFDTEFLRVLAIAIIYSSWRSSASKQSSCYSTSAKQVAKRA
jgi:hypothetical protein